MDCNIVLKNLVAYLDSELDAETQNAIRQHLANCPNCNQEVHAFDRTWALLDKYPELTPQPQAIGQIKDRIQTLTTVKPVSFRRWSWQKIAGLAVAAGLIIGLGLYLVTDTFKPDTGPTVPTVVNAPIENHTAEAGLLDYYKGVLAAFEETKEENGWNTETLKELSPYLFSDEWNF